MSVAYKFNTYTDRERKLLTLRPIGPMPGSVFVEKLFEFYATLEEPWTYGRINDFRRFEGKLAQADLDEIGRRWIELARGRTYKAYVAVVTFDRTASFRVAIVSPQFPNETICVFTDYHEAVQWVLAPDRDAYLSRLETPRAALRRSHDISVE